MNPEMELLLKSFEPMTNKMCSDIMDLSLNDEDVCVVLGEISAILVHVATAAMLREAPPEMSLERVSTMVEYKVGYTVGIFREHLIDHMRKTLDSNDIPDPWAEEPQPSINEQTAAQILEEISEQEG